MHRFLLTLKDRDPGAAALLSPDTIAHFAGLSEAIRGREAWIHLFSAYVAAFPDIEIAIHDEIAGGTPPRRTLAGVERIGENSWASR